MRYLALFLTSVSLLAAQTPPPAAPATTAAASATVTTAPASVPVEQVLSVPEPGRFKALFQPFRTDRAALSPDGKYLAYSVREGESVSIVVIEIDQPDKMKSHVELITDEQATPMLALNQRERTPARVNWMKWVSPTRLLAETNKVFAKTVGADSNWQSWRGCVIGFDADGGNAKLLATPFDLEEFTASGSSDFSTARDDSKFLSRVGSPDQPTGSAIDPFAATETPADSSDPAAPPTSPTDITTSPRTLRIFDFDAKNEGAVTIVSTGARALGLYSLNSQSGKLTAIHDDIMIPNSDAMIDRQGKIRFTLPSTKRSDFPFRYEYLGPKGNNRGKPFDQTAGLGTTDAFSVSPENFFGQRAIPLGFDENPDVLYYASNLGRDTYGIYSLNLATKERGKVALENPAYDLITPPEGSFPDARQLVFDRFQHTLVGVRYENALRTTAWLRPELYQLQSQLEKKFAGRAVTIIDWDQSLNRFLFTTESPADPGAFFVYDVAKVRMSEFVRRAPWIEENHLHLTLPFSFGLKDGARVSGLVTAPKNPRLKPIPMVVLCPDYPWQRVRSEFQTDVQALANMGFVVVQLNGRGAWGMGLKQRQSLTAGYDLVQVEDIVTTIVNLEKIFAVNPRRVAVMGRGHGGFIALRAVQTYPEKFRCAVAIDAPVDLGAWLEEQRWSSDDVQATLRKGWLGDQARLKAKPLVSQSEKVTKPILMLNYPGPDGKIRTGAYAQARQFAGKVRSNGTVAEFDNLETDYVNGLPAARGAVFERIEAFLNQYVYTPNVKLGDTIYKDDVKTP